MKSAPKGRVRGLSRIPRLAPSHWLKPSLSIAGRRSTARFASPLTSHSTPSQAAATTRSSAAIRPLGVASVRAPKSTAR
ncbi:MAG: hypothetical protein BWZ10_03194 [candidate division BRC1 bacterium ADurb.BinA364]|nr:MAG: hypothetical protein BWZ10_03194 [candidate division BRC1 bacterium ADurb.BinA364]